MERPNKDTTVESYLDHSAFTTAGVAADPDVAGLEAGLVKEHTALKKQKRDLEDLGEEVQRKKAIFVGKDRRLDRVVREFELRLLALVNKNRQDPLYQRYFAGGLREVTEAEPRQAEPALVATMIISLSEDENKPAVGSLAKEFRPLFEAARGEVVQAEADLAETEKKVSYLDDKSIPETEARWTDAYVALHGALKAALPRDPARVEAFFYPFRKDKKEKKAAGEPGGGGGAPGGGAPGGGAGGGGGAPGGGTPGGG
jgi:uncharacterized membrane protein YgcG